MSKYQLAVRTILEQSQSDSIENLLNEAKLILRNIYDKQTIKELKKFLPKEGAKIFIERSSDRTKLWVIKYTIKREISIQKLKIN